jgi:hypothetical protein
MSYLNSLRLHFAGKFQAAPSTVNNDPLHFNNQTFQPSFQEPQTGNKPSQLNGWWNPGGDAAWRLIACKVTSAFVDNNPVPEGDPVSGCLIADSDLTVSAKLVDLDPEQQTVSEVWGMQVRICRPDGVNLLRGFYKTAAFIDIWDRAPGGGDLIAGAAYTSVLHGLEWGPIDGSEFLTKLRDASAESGKLSIKFNVDGYNMDPKSADFTRGRIVGSIGPALPDEPDHLTIGRHFMAVATGGGNFFVPQGKINFCPAVVNAGEGKIYVDLGNSLPTTVSGGPISPLGTLSLGYLGATTATIDTIPYLQENWYQTTAGVASVPASRKLTGEEIEKISANPLVLTLTDANGNTQGGINEPADGLYARADQFVFRAAPGDTVEARIYATRYGQCYPGARIVNILDPSQLQPSSPLGPAPTVGAPESALDFEARVITDKNGCARVPIRISDPGNPRQFIDGQVYGIRPLLEETLAYGTNDTYNPWDFISLLAFSRFEAASPLVWYGPVQSIFEQYANLYPVMKRFLNMTDYDSVCENVKLLLLVFGLPLDDPNSMPVTRDLSPAKRAAIVRWLSEPGPDGKPLKGIAPKTPIAAAAAPTPAALPEQPVELPQRGGKASAASRRLFLIRRR